MGDALRFGLVGAGPWARRVHVPGLLDHPAIDLVGVWTRRPEAAADLPVPHIPDYRDLLSQVDAVAFAVPPAAQADLAATAAAAGKHVLLEKPIADTPARARHLTDAVEAAGVISLVNLVRRFAPETVAWLAELHRAGTWAGASARWLSGALLGGDYATSTWRHEGGALADIGPHVLDLLDAALGPVDKVLSAHHHTPDLWHLVLGHHSGATSTATLSMHLPMRPTITEISVYGTPGYRELTGRATAPTDAFTTALDLFTALVAENTPAHPLDARRGLMLSHLTAAVLAAT
ncbi:Gfo/Idh/MocA family protein [Actinokineospora guangxiensis]|uniref:Gfo/Idh/MocA family protein n=1 Tax=Actinokineospora guangxiensis TaxID=1490288 RepID=A0ABW0EXF6_9PSEU